MDEREMADEEKAMTGRPRPALVPPVPRVIISGHGFEILPLNLKRLRQLVPLRAAIIESADPAFIFMICLKVVKLATLRNRRQAWRYRKLFAEADKEQIERAFHQVMDKWDVIEK